MTDDESILSATDLSMIVRAAAPLRPRDRERFIEDVAQALQGRGDVGPGLIHRTVRDVQRRYFDPPLE